MSEKPPPQASEHERVTSSDEESQTPAVSYTALGMKVSNARGTAVIATLAGMNFLNTMGSGILIAALPRIARDVGLPEGLVLWPAAVYALAAGCLLHVFGSFADIIGPKQIWAAGSLLFAVFTIALGFAATGLQVIMFRTWVTLLAQHSAAFPSCHKLLLPLSCNLRVKTWLGCCPFPSSNK